MGMKKVEVSELLAFRMLLVFGVVGNRIEIATEVKVVIAAVVGMFVIVEMTVTPFQ